MSKEIYLVRHGETDLNRQGIVQGRGVNPPLNEVGKKQAQCFFEWYGQVPFEKIYTSTLLRAQQSVEEFIRKGIPWEARPELDEISWGVFEGKPTTPEVKSSFKEYIKAWNAGHLTVHAPGGESPLQVRQREEHFLADMELKPERLILICMHGRAMRMLLTTMLRLPLTDMDKFPHRNLTLYKLIFDGARYSLTLSNNTDHLKYDKQS